MQQWYYSVILSKNKTRVICHIPPTFTTKQEMLRKNNNALPIPSDTEQTAWSRYILTLVSIKRELIDVRAKRIKYLDNKISDIEKIIQKHKDGDSIR